MAAVVAVVGCLVWAGAAGANAIGRANLDGSGVQPGFVSVAGSSFLGGVAVDGGHIYWANPAAHAVGRANLDGTHVEQSFITVPLVGPGVLLGPSSVAVGAGHLYWGSTEGYLPFGPSQTYLGRANTDGTGVEPHFMTDAGGSKIAVESTHLYWTETNTIGRANLDGTGIQHNFITGLGSLGSLAAANGHIYWVDNCVNRTPGGTPPPCSAAIGRAKLDGADVQRAFITTGVEAWSVPGLAVDARHIYWTSSDHNSPFPPPDTIRRANLDGSNVEQSFITVQGTDLEGLAVDTGHIYWSGSRSGLPKRWILGLHITPRTFTLTGRLVNGRCVPATRANRNRRPCSRPIELKISYKLNPGPFPALVLFSIQRRVAGRLVGGRCVAPTRANRRNPNCTRLIAYPRQEPLSQTGKAGWNSLTFNGIITTYDAHGHPQLHKLTPGSYLLTANIPLGNNKTTSFQIAP